MVAGDPTGNTQKSGGATAMLWKRASKGKSRQAMKTVSHNAFVGKYSAAEMLPLVQREVSALANQRIKVREPSDFLKIQQRVKNDLESLNHTNAFFRQRHSAYLNIANQPLSGRQSRA